MFMKKCNSNDSRYDYEKDFTRFSSVRDRSKKEKEEETLNFLLALLRQRASRFKDSNCDREQKKRSEHTFQFFDSLI